MTAPTSSPTPTPTRRGGEIERKTIVLSALILFGALIIGIVLMAVFSDPGTEPQPTTTESGSPHIIDRPNSGSKPEGPGDRGGAEQLLLLGGMVLAVGGIGYAALRGGSQARANRERWKAAAASGEDGALDQSSTP